MARRTSKKVTVILPPSSISSNPVRLTTLPRDIFKSAEDKLAKKNPLFFWQGEIKKAQRKKTKQILAGLDTKEIFFSREGEDSYDP